MTAKEARRLVEDAIERTAGKTESGKAGPNDLKVGERVKTGQGKVGVVAEIRSDGRVGVEIGAVRLVIAPELLERVDGS